MELAKLEAKAKARSIRHANEGELKETENAKLGGRGEANKGSLVPLLPQGKLFHYFA